MTSQTIGTTNRYYAYWGKASPAASDAQSASHHLLVYHSLDVAAVAQRLFQEDQRWCPFIAAATDLVPEQIRYLMTLAMMLHDMGKFSKTFQALVPGLFERLFPDAKLKPYSERHDTLGFLLWRGDPGALSIGVRSHFHSWAPDVCEMLEPIIRASFGHHGLPPRESSRTGSVLRASSFFDDEDLSAARSFVTASISILGNLPGFPKDTRKTRKNLKQMSWTIAGLAVLSDWIGSNTDFFPYVNQQIDLADYWVNTARPNAERALSLVGWKPHQPAPRIAGSSFVSLFPQIEEPTPLQSCCVEMPLSEGPQLLIVEDVTGAGKTEAATVLADRIMASGAADGLYIGLPTMATANAMYGRMQAVYRRLFADGEKPSLVLSHGARHLSEAFSATVVVHAQGNDRPYGAESTASAMCNEWYADNRKKALLADVGIGTIDQALLSVLPARHQSLRLLGLNRKVLVIDEVHAYDPYMEHLLAVLLEAHARGGGSAILLSATIPKKKKRELIAAFHEGLSHDALPHSSPDEDAFPQVTRVGEDGTDVYPVGTRKEVRRSVAVEFVHSYEECVELIEARALAGQCVCWIRNTVRDARRSYWDIITHGAVATERVSLFHSRFAMVDRARIEQDALARFGDKSDASCRVGRVLIATQVVEQSLDLDFDYLVTDLAPIDLVIQRAGRLHRHLRDRFGNRKPPSDGVDGRGTPIVTIFAPVFDKDADKDWLAGDFAGTAAIYRNPGILWRTQKMLGERQGWQMPEDARELIEMVYGEDQAFESPAGLDEGVIRAFGDDQSKRSMGHLSALVLARGYCRDAVATDQWLDDERIATRLTEETREVALAVSVNGVLLPYADTNSYPWDWSCLSVSERAWRSVAYEVPAAHRTQVDDLRSANPRLKYTEIVIVSMRSPETMASDRPVCDFYHPRLGWGAPEEARIESDQ